MPKRKLPTQRQITIDRVTRPHTHHIWHENTGYWPIIGEVIHHIDGNPENNEFSNLALMIRAEHQSLHHLGKHRSAETRARMREVQSGEKHPNWKGGITKDIDEYMRNWRAKHRKGIRTKEELAKLSVDKLGEKNPNWKGGISKDRKEYQRMRRARIRADKEGNT